MYVFLRHRDNELAVCGNRRFGIVPLKIASRPGMVRQYRALLSVNRRSQEINTRSATDLNGKLQ